MGGSGPQKMVRKLRPFALTVTKRTHPAVRLSSDRVHASRPRCRNGQDTRGVYAVGPSNQAATKLQAGPSHAAYGRRSSVRCAVCRCVGCGECTSGGLELKVHMIRAQREVEGDGR